MRGRAPVHLPAHALAQDLAASRRRRAVALVGLGILTLGIARAQLPRVSAGLGTGFGGMRREESIAGVTHLTESTACTAAAWWYDFTWDSSARWTVGLHLHSMSVQIEDGGSVGSMDLLPVLLQLGLRRPLISERLWGFASAGVGITDLKFTPTDETGGWEAAGGGDVQFTQEHPLTLALNIGLDYGIDSNLLLEAGLGAVSIDSKLTYQRARAPDEGFVEDKSAEVSASHLLATIGIRWWCEWW